MAWPARPRRARALLAVLLLVPVVVVVAVVVVATSAGDTRDPRDCRGASMRCLFVDPDSLGGRCSDKRSVAAVRSAKTPWCSLKRAVTAAPAGSHVAVRRGAYPLLSIKAIDRARAVTLGAYPGERVDLPGLRVEHSSGFRLHGFHVSSPDTPSSVIASQRIAILSSDFSGQGLILRAVRETTIAGNRIHDLRRPPGPDGFEGYGIWANGFLDGGADDGLDGLVIRRNVFRNIPQDGVQLGGGTELVSRVLIEGNDFGFVRRAVESDHPDPIQVMGGRGIVIRSNRFHDSEDAIIAKDDVTTGLVVENNLMIGWRGGCIQAQFWNTPGARVVHNTILRSTCLGLRFATDPEVGHAPSGLVVRRNIIDSYEAGEPGWVADQDYNVIVHGRRSGPHDSGRRPQFERGLRPVGTAARLRAGSSLRVQP
jgi:hypothetical protein